MPASQNVLPDPQYGVFRVLRPQDNFTNFYQGEAAGPTNPIYFYEEGDPLDPQAGEVGYDPALIKGLGTPLGANLVIWTPALSYIETAVPLVIRSYIWFLIWRVRNIVTFRRQRASWHMAVTRGVTDTTPVTGGERTIIPAGYEPVVYNQPEPVSATAPEAGRVVQHGRAEDMTMGITQLGAPFIAAGQKGVVQQGIQDPATLPDAVLPRFLEMSTRSKGDELLIGIYREDTPVNWGFALGEADALMADFFNDSDNNGIYVSMGTP